MFALVVRRLVSLIPILLIVTFIVFMLTELVPGDAATTIAEPVPSRLAAADHHGVQPRPRRQHHLPTRRVRWEARRRVQDLHQEDGRANERPRAEYDGEQ